MSHAVNGWCRALALAGIVVALDQATKQIAQGAIERGEDVELPLGFALTNVGNRGIAFGLFGDGSPLVVAVAALGLVLVLAYFASSPARPGLWVAVGLLVGGALGNLADRVRDDAVTDYVDPPLWPAFNLADVAIVIGVAILVLSYGWWEPQAARRPRGG